MKLIWSSKDVLNAVSGRCLHMQNWTANGISIDSRTTQENDLFIAIKGDSFDGHDYIAKAFENGACAAIVSKQPSQVPSDAPLIFVQDTFIALQDIGNAGRARSNAKIIGVTGSVGKTSTKEMLQLMLGCIDDTYANVGSFNNHWGVPLSLARLPSEAKFGIFEMGMNHAGEMEDLTKKVKPDVVIINNIEEVHLEFFKSTKYIADAKAEIFQGMGKSGIAVLNKDTKHYERLVSSAKKQGIKKIYSFGYNEKSDAKLIDIKIKGSTTDVTAKIFGKKKNFSIGAAGEHLALNSLGCLMICSALDVDLDQCIKALIAYRDPKGRGTTQTININNDQSFILIDQSFNASPISTKSAINVLGKTETSSTSSRKIVILGDMGELGENAKELHISLLSPITENKIDVVHCCGKIMKNLYDKLPDFIKGKFCETSEELAKIISNEIQDGDIVMVKGSKATKMDKIITALKKIDYNLDEKIAS